MERGGGCAGSVEGSGGLSCEEGLEDESETAVEGPNECRNCCRGESEGSRRQYLFIYLVCCNSDVF